LINSKLMGHARSWGAELAPHAEDNSRKAPVVTRFAQLNNHLQFLLVAWLHPEAHAHSASGADLPSAPSRCGAARTNNAPTKVFVSKLPVKADHERSAYWRLSAVHCVL